LSEAAASTHINHPEAAAPASTAQDSIGIPCNIIKLALQSEASMEVMALTPPSPASEYRNLGFHPESPSLLLEGKKMKLHDIAFKKVNDAHRCLMTHKYRGSQQYSREVKPKFIDSTQVEPKNICKP
jgi:hypothetical protein